MFQTTKETCLRLRGDGIPSAQEHSSMKSLSLALSFISVRLKGPLLTAMAASRSP